MPPCCRHAVSSDADFSSFLSLSFFAAFFTLPRFIADCA